MSMTATPVAVTPGVTPNVTLTCRVTGNVTAATPAVVGRRGAGGDDQQEELTTSVTVVDGRDSLRKFDERRDTTNSADIDSINSIIIKNIKYD